MSNSKLKTINSELSNSPIGIFDSGIGGLTVAKAISDALPNESLVYFGDTVHMPYGEKSTEAICRYAIRIGDFLIGKGCKMIVMACNTASAVAFNTLKAHCKGKVEIVNVIGPVLDHIVHQDSIKKIGIIGTQTTINSDVYKKALAIRNPEVETMSLATPLLAPMIEEGFANSNISQAVLQSYLSDIKLNDINALILACTHYPLIKQEIEAYYNNKILIVDSPALVAERVKRLLQYDELLNEQTGTKHHFFVSDYTESFEKTTSMFYGTSLKLEQVTLPI